MDNRRPFGGGEAGFKGIVYHADNNNITVRVGSYGGSTQAMTITCNGGENGIMSYVGKGGSFVGNYVSATVASDGTPGVFQHHHNKTLSTSGGTCPTSLSLPYGHGAGAYGASNRTSGRTEGYLKIRYLGWAI